MIEPKHDQHGREPGHPHHGHPISPEAMAARVKARDERVREGHRKARHGHEHLHARPLHVYKLDGTVVPGAHPAPEYTDPEHVALFARVRGATLTEVWAEFWLQAEREKSHDPPGPARDQLILHYGTHGFLEERYAREQKRGGK